ncbi:MAG: hypothetical protein DME98_01660 [Verrucomicrobia bacterium]|nr:MAG: hypothetical protein DME98_01660 [Verrucomicrobiota bacterium]PYJ32658.1 MAG: hypothetical protein DME88_10285 [Verrucomicrobiota bacterium]
MFKRMTKSECRSSKEWPNDKADRDAASWSLVFWASFVVRHSCSGIYDLPLRTELIWGMPP